MAITVQKIYIDPVKFPTSKTPSGHSVDVAPDATLTSPQISEELEFEIAAFDVVAATAVAAFDDLLKVELLADIDAYIAAATGLGIKTGTHTVKYNAKVTDVHLGDEGQDIYLNSSNVNFIVTLSLEVTISA